MSRGDIVKRPVTLEDVVVEAREALATIEAVISAATDHETTARSEREYVASTLLRASCDQARAMALLLSQEPGDLGAVALSVHRGQLELFVRGMFFGREATEAELASFLNDDELPFRPGPDGKLKRVNFKQMAAMAEANLDLAPTTPGVLGPLAESIRAAWDPLCGMVHGGHSLLHAYRAQGEGIGASVRPSLMLQVLSNAVATAIHVLGGYLLIAVSREELDRLFRPAVDRVSAYHDARKKRWIVFTFE